MAGDRLSQISPPSHMAVQNLTAYRTTVNGQNWLSGSFVVRCWLHFRIAVSLMLRCAWSARDMGMCMGMEPQRAWSKPH